MDDYKPFDDHVPFGQDNSIVGGGSPPGRANWGSLSTAHICPFYEYRSGASLLKVSKGGLKDDQIGGGLRGRIKGFSDASRRRLMRTIAGIKRDAVLPLFVTLTYPYQFPDPLNSKKHLRSFIKRLSRAYPLHGLIWKLEPQKRGAPHFHILLWGYPIEKVMRFIPEAWFEIAGNGDKNHLAWHKGELDNSHCVQEVRTWKGVWSYASKYLGKTFEVSGWGEKWTGRFWGVVNCSNIPFGELVNIKVSKSQAVTANRYQRRFSGLKSNKKSLTIFCDADQWVDKIF